MRKKFYRIRYILDSRIQSRYLAFILVSMLVPLVFVGACLYYFILTIMAEQLGVPEYIAYNLFPVINKINIMLLIGIPPIFLLLFIWGVVLSHRFAGPIDRLEKDVKNILDHRNYKIRIKLRKHDDIKLIANLINRLVERLDENEHK